MIAGGCAEVQPPFMKRKNPGAYGPVNVIRDKGRRDRKGMYYEKNAVYI